jgi:hypothetical protein
MFHDHGVRMIGIETLRYLRPASGERGRAFDFQNTPWCRSNAAQSVCRILGDEGRQRLQAPSSLATPWALCLGAAVL